VADPLHTYLLSFFAIDAVQGYNFSFFDIFYKQVISICYKSATLPTLTLQR